MYRELPRMRGRLQPKELRRCVAFFMDHDRSLPETGRVLGMTLSPQSWLHDIAEFGATGSDKNRTANGHHTVPCFAGHRQGDVCPMLGDAQHGASAGGTVIHAALAGA
jgi:hypothetical protein